MVHIVGYDNILREYKLFNTDAPLGQALKRCSYDFQGLSELMASQQWVDDMQKLQSQPFTADRVEFKILYYSCDYDKKNGLLHNIRLHLTNGEVVHPDVLRYNKECSYQELNQLSRFTGDTIELGGQACKYLGYVYLLSEKTMKLVHNIHMFYFKINGAERFISLVSGTEKENSVKPVYFFATSIPRILGGLMHANSLGYTLAIYVISYDKSTGIFHCKTRIETFNGMLNTTSGFNTNKLNKWYVASRLVDSKVGNLTGDNSLLDNSLRAFDSFNYIATKVLGLKNSSEQIDSTLLDFIDIVKPCVEDIQQMIDTLSTFGVCESHLKIVVDGELKALANMTNTNITLDISNIKSIDTNALLGLQEVTISCTGELALERCLIKEPDGPSITYSSTELYDKVMGNSVEPATD